MRMPWGEMKIATFNVNGINGRLPVLMRWLGETEPDVACLQELKASDDKFPELAIRKAGYRAVWHGQKSWNGVAILARDRVPTETRRGLPGDPDDAHSRYIEAAVDGVLIGCLYLPNGNPAPARGSTTSCAGSIDWPHTLRSSWRPACRSYSLAISM
jgi:exodeoxyribonuclease III